MKATEVMEGVANGTIAPSDGAAQINDLLTGGIAQEGADDPRVSRVQAMLDEVTPEYTPTLITIIITIKRC